MAVSANRYCTECIVELILGYANDASADALRGAGMRAFQQLHADVRTACNTDGSTLTVCMLNQKRQELTTELLE